jgi:hypothetical protein
MLREAKPIPALQAQGARRKARGELSLSGRQTVRAANSRIFLPKLGWLRYRSNGARMDFRYCDGSSANCRGLRQSPE